MIITVEVEKNIYIYLFVYMYRVYRVKLIDNDNKKSS